VAEQAAPGGPGELRVDPLRVINILKQRLVDEQARSATFEAALQESQARELELTMRLARAAAPAE
jgi:hypothetical protein